MITLLTYLNRRLLKLPTPIGVMVMALGMSLLLIVINSQTSGDWARHLTTQFSFSHLILDGMLGFLLFASALQLDVQALARHKWSILLLATLSTALSTLSIGVLVYYALQVVGIELSFIYALVFGALISPTDPVAVAGLLREAGLSDTLTTVITGESLFNDGMGIVMFTVLIGLAVAHPDITAGSVAVDFIRETVGGILLGVSMAYVATIMIGRAGDFTTTTLLTLTLVTGGYTLATALGTSGPLSMAAAGLVVGTRVQAQPDRKYLDAYWKITENLLNAALFVLIGLELLVIPFDISSLVAAAIAVPLVLLSRFLSVSVALTPVRLTMFIPKSAIGLLTWAALRGAIAIALALSLPAGPERELILVMTYGVVLFSVLVQGLTIKKVAAAMQKKNPEPR